MKKSMKISVLLLCLCLCTGCGKAEEADADSTTEATTESSQNKTVIIEIVGGMSSYPVCQLLEEAGVIDNADAFDSYLMQNGYAERLVVGQHEVKKGMSDQEIATAITTPNY